MSSTLMTMNSRFASKLVSLATLQALAEPPSLGPHHRPIPHHRLIEGLEREVARRGYAVQRRQLALSEKGTALFGVYDLVRAQTNLLDYKQAERVMSMGIRNAVDQSLAAYLVAGTHVTVCDNLSMMGSICAMRRKNTIGLQLGPVITAGFDKFLQHSNVLDLQITRMADTKISDADARQFIYRVFAIEELLPSRLLADVHSFYFKPTAEMTDCQDRTMWGLHNAFTRAMRELTPMRVFGATIDIGKAFGMGLTSDEPAIDAEFSRADLAVA